MKDIYDKIRESITLDELGLLEIKNIKVFLDELEMEINLELIKE
jgi:hypothetical protein